MHRLIEYCKKYFFEHISIENSLETLKLAVENDAFELTSQCRQYIAK
jgi:hypothetical protein